MFMTNETKKLMIFRFSAMGDVAMTVPVIQALLKSYPDTEVVMVSRPFFEPLFASLPRTKFVGVDLKQTYKGLWGLFRLYKFLKQEKPDAIADLHDVLRTKILSAFFKLGGFTNIAVIDKGRAEKKALIRPQNKIFKPLKTTHRRYAEVFDKLGFHVDIQHFKPVLPPLSNQVKLFLAPLQDQKVMGIAPFAAHKGKQYPLEKMQEVIRLLLKKDADLVILLFGGGKTEKTLLDDLEQIDRNRVINVAGIFSFEEELQLISRLQLMLSMDSGNGHLAALFGVPVLTIWGATHPYAGFAPFNQPDENWILPDLKQFPQLPTSVYGNKTFEGFEKVWNTIKPDAVVEKILSLLHQL